MEFIISIDTEADNQWEHGRELTVENIKFVPRFQDLCNRYQIKPTYLVTSEICDDPFAQEIFRDYLSEEKAEIGAHLHSWTTPPFQDKDGYRYNDKRHAFANELAEDLIAEKIKTLTYQIESAFGKRPFSFRSGRYGFNAGIARILAENNYLVDSSVTPHTRWNKQTGIAGGSGGPDFMDKTSSPYRYNFANNSLLEIPVTILPTRFPLHKYNSLAKFYFKNVDKSIPLRIFRKLFFANQPLWLRPHNWMNIGLFTEIVKEAKRINLPFIVMMFHSSELMPGCSIYRSDESAIEQLYDLLNRFFILIQKEGVKCVTLTEAAKNYVL